MSHDSLFPRLTIHLNKENGKVSKEIISKRNSGIISKTNMAGIIFRD